MNTITYPDGTVQHTTERVDDAIVRYIEDHDDRELEPDYHNYIVVVEVDMGKQYGIIRSCDLLVYSESEFGWDVSWWRANKVRVIKFFPVESLPVLFPAILDDGV